jgi:predicted aldo/keto reductase-like oxidoreductase
MTDQEHIDESVPIESIVPRRPLGSTGAIVSMIGIGGYHIGMPDLPEAESIRLIRTAIDSGIDFMDNSWDYHNGQSEKRMGKALLDGYRDKAFLMTKIDGRDRRTAMGQLDDSLKRLQTDHVDLLQFHEIIHGDDPDRVFAAGGALEAVLEARDQGRVRFIGFTGHKSPDHHNRMLDLADSLGFRFDTVQMPLNVLDAHFESFEKSVLPRVVAKGVGVLGMKPMGSGKILETDTVTPIECLHYAMSLPTSVVITGCESIRMLEQAVIAGRSFRQLEDEEMSRLRARTAMVARDGRFEKYKTSLDHDSTTMHPQWMGGKPEARIGR